METTGARDGPNTRDDGAMVLYARAPVVRVGEGRTVGNAMGARESAVLVRCLAAIASASGRELVLTTAEETPEGGTRAARVRRADDGAVEILAGGGRCEGERWE